MPTIKPAFLLYFSLPQPIDCKQNEANKNEMEMKSSREELGDSDLEEPSLTKKVRHCKQFD